MPTLTLPTANETHRRMNRFFLCLAVFAGTFFAIGVFAASYGDSSLLHADALFAEAFYRDIALEGGNVAAWTFPMPSYWLDHALYFAVRHCSPDVHVGTAAYAAMQALLVVLGVAYCCASVAGVTTRLSTVVWSAVAVSLVCLHGSFFSIVRMPVMHGLTIAMFFFAVGLLCRYVETQSTKLLAALALVTGIGAACDGIFTVWFTLPALLYLLVLAFFKKIKKWIALRSIVWMVGFFLLGRAIDVLLRPSHSDYSAAHPSLAKMVANTPVLLQRVPALFSDTSLIAVYLIALLSLFFTHKILKRNFVVTVVFILCSSFLGIILNGRTEITYINTVIIAIPFLLLPLIPLAMSEKWLKATCVAGVLGLACFATFSLQSMRGAYYPPMAQCIDAVSEEHGVNNVASTFWEAFPLALFSRSEPQTDNIHSRSFLHRPGLSPTMPRADSYRVVVLNTASASFADQDAAMRAINGLPSQEFLCPNTRARFSVYAENGARLASIWDYLKDDVGLYASSRIARDVTHWEGTAEVAPGVTLQKIEAKYRLDNMWLLFYFKESEAVLADKKITFSVHSDKSKTLRKFAAKRLSKDANAWLDSFWLRLVWSKTLSLYANDSRKDWGDSRAEGNGTVVALPAPSRDMRKIFLAAFTVNGHTSVLKIPNK